MSLELFFQEDLKSGQPHLYDPAGMVSDADRIEVERELKRKFVQLISKSESFLTFSPQFRSLPQPARFRVFVEKGPNSRCPTLRLRHESMPVFGSGLDAKRSPNEDAWPRAFFADLQRRLQSAGDSCDAEAERLGLRFALGEMQTLVQAWPDELAPLLFAGYLALAEHMCHGQDDERKSLYVLAGRVLERAFEERLGVYTATPGGWRMAVKTPLRVATRLLAWLIGDADTHGK